MQPGPGHFPGPWGPYPFPGFQPGMRPPMMAPPMGGPPLMRPPMPMVPTMPQQQPPGPLPQLQPMLRPPPGFIHGEAFRACGKLREWKPVTEPETGKLKGFGFVTFAEPEGVMVALRVLNNLKVDGQELALKCNKATEEYIEWYKQQQQERKAGQAAQEGSSGKDDGSDEDAAPADAAEDAALSAVMELISQRPALDPAKPADSNAAAAADTFLSTLSGSKDGHPERGSSRDGGASSAERKRDRESEREADRERQRQKREEQRKAEAEERAYREAVRLWEDHERLRQRELEKDRDRQADLQKERQRQVHADNEAVDTDDEQEPWRRRPYSSSRRAAERRRRRDLERQDEEADRKKQALEEEAAAVAAAAAAGTANGMAESGDAGGGEVQPASVSNSGVEAAGAAFGADDTILQAMLAAVKPKQEPVMEHVQPQQAAAPPAAAAKRRMRPTFADEEEEEQKVQRKLIPIRYSEEELRALADQADPAQAAQPQLLASAGPAQSAPATVAPQPVAAAPAAAPTQHAATVDPVARKKQLLTMIPKDKAAVFAFPVDWAVLDNAPHDVKEKISTWVTKKVAELLGEEPSFCRFIMEQLSAHISASAMLDALKEVLDEDAEKFTVKLWQILAYEQLKLTVQ